MEFASEKKLHALSNIPSGIINNRLIKVSMTFPFLKLTLWRNLVLSWYSIFCLINYKTNSIHLNLDKIVSNHRCVFMEQFHYILKTSHMRRINILVFGMGTDGSINTQYDLFFKWIYITNYHCMIILIHK